MGMRNRFIEFSPNERGTRRVRYHTSKDSSTPGLLKAMENKDKVVALSYMAAERNITITYRSQTEEARRESASS